jgi:hypothetical protein
MEQVMRVLSAMGAVVLLMGWSMAVFGIGVGAGPGAATDPTGASGSHRAEMVQAPRLPEGGKILKILLTDPAFRAHVVPGADSEPTESEVVDNAAEPIPMHVQRWYGSLMADGFVDTHEEFLTAVRLIPFRPAHAGLRKAIAEEFPEGLEGYYRLGCLWFRARGLQRDEYGRYDAVVAKILQAARAQGLPATEAGLREYYEKALRMDLEGRFAASLLRRGVKLGAGGSGAMTDVARKNAAAVLAGPWWEHFAHPSATSLEHRELVGMALVAWAEEDATRVPLREAYDEVVQLVMGEWWVNYESDREYYRGWHDEVGAARTELERSLKGAGK